MTKIAITGPATGTGTYTLRAPDTASTLDFELPTVGTHLASAQADGMPLGPGGDPVVESGSNTDGQWTRWADGTQSTTRIEEGGNGAIDPGTRYNSPTFQHPLPYLNGAILEGYVVLRASYPDQLQGGIEATTTSTSYQYSIVNNHSSQITDITHGARFTGRWK